METTVKRLKVLINEAMSDERGDDPYHPVDHSVGAQVPKGGSMCANCSFLTEDEEGCTSDLFQKWHADQGVDDPSRLPHPADEYCCDFWTGS